MSSIRPLTTADVAWCFNMQYRSSREQKSSVLLMKEKLKRSGRQSAATTLAACKQGTSMVKKPVFVHAWQSYAAPHTVPAFAWLALMNDSDDRNI